VPRRVHVSAVRTGELSLEAAQARHARDVLRLKAGTVVEVFDDAGRAAAGELIVVSPREVVVRIDSIPDQAAEQTSFQWTIAAAVPKGERADWMVEKLSELGAAEFVPLAAARSVVLPEGKNKRDRWARIATESAKQSRRDGVMRVGELTRVGDCVTTLADVSGRVGWYFSTASDARTIAELAAAGSGAVNSLVAFIGPEGGWSDEEIAGFATAGVIAVRLTDTVLRVETAAVAAAAVIGSVIAPGWARGDARRS
jgi:16S rRNA (uracil1498-N3)-methyltransferase